MLTDQSRHLEHGHDALALEHDLQDRVGVNVVLILLILETVLLDVSPELLGELGAGSGFEPTTAERASSGCTGFMKLRRVYGRVSLPWV